MGVIDQLPTREQNTDNAVFTIPEERKKKEVEDPVFTNKELSVTNEALKIMDLKKALEIDPMSNEHNPEIKGILAWAKEEGIKNKTQLLAEIKEIDYMLGQGTGKDKITRIYQYIKLRSSIRSSVRQMEALKR